MFNLITLQLGNDVMVAVQAEMARRAVRRTALIDGSTRSRRDLKQAFPEVRWSFFEPDFKTGLDGQVSTRHPD